MKRLFFLLPIIAAIASCGSKTPVKAPDIDMSFSAEARISYSGGECTAQMRRFSEDCWEYCITEPFALEGAVIRIEEGKSKITMFDTEAAADINTEAVSAARLITDAVEAAIDNSTGAAEADGIISVRGQSPTSTYTLTFKNDSTPFSLDIDGRGITVEFTKFVPMEDGDEEIIMMEN